MSGKTRTVAQREQLRDDGVDTPRVVRHDHGEASVLVEERREGEAEAEEVRIEALHWLFTCEKSKEETSRKRHK